MDFMISENVTVLINLILRLAGSTKIYNYQKHLCLHAIKIKKGLSFNGYFFFERKILS